MLVGLSKLKTLAYRAWATLPLLGGLADASKKAHADALKELVFVWTLSLLPIFLTSLIEAVRSSTLGLWDSLRNNVQSGEIFIYANALLAPIAFIVCKHIRDEAKFPNYTAFMWLIWIVVPVSTIIFALQRAGLVSNQALVDKLALSIFIVAFVMRYTSLVYDSFRINFVSTQKAQEKDLEDKLRAARNKIN